MDTTRKVIIIIPARAGSKRLLKKNTLPIKEKPLFWYSINAAKESGISKYIYVLSDDIKILEQAKEYGAIPFHIPPELAGDTTEVVNPSIYAIDTLNNEQNLQFDDFICLQPTSPLRNANDIKESYATYVKTLSDSLVSIAKVDPHFFHWAVEKSEDTPFAHLYFGNKFLKSRTELPKMYWPNGAIKIAKVDFIKKQGNFFGENMAVYEMPQERSVHIATEFEYKICKNIIENDNADNQNNHPNKVLVIGVGSIGERHAKNLRSLGKDVYIFDLDTDKVNTLSRDNGFCVILEINVDTLKEFSAVFVCTPSHLHLDPAKIALQAGCHLFIEKPIAVQSSIELQELNHVAKESKCTTLVGCNMRFHPSIQKLKNILDSKSLGKIYSVHVYVGQFLPFWRKVDYQQTYSAKAAFGGGMLLEGIHEFDYICWLFGEVEEIYASTTKISNLKIDAEDLAEVILKFKNGIIGHIHLDCLQKQKRRGYEVIGEHQTITWESIGNAPEKSIIKIFGSQNEQPEIIESIINPNSMYIDELRYFFDCIENRTETMNNLHNAISILHLVEAAKISTQQKKVIFVG